ncbi:unnamed protein product [Lupinus luteus]|uniref:Uncharacterized protein n=1 Tax=Lupinus luteus TaxID=3873 RepID=A0AAV1YIG1_LUPLU
MITMDLKGITWMGNLYHKFENMCLEAEDMIYQDTVKYIENQMQAVGESVKKLYADVTRDLLLPSSCDLDDKVASEFPTDQSSDAGFCKMSDEFTSSFEDSVKGNNFISCSRQYVQSMDIKSDLGIDEDQAKNKMAATKISHGAVSVSKPDSAEVTRLLASAGDCCYEIKNASIEQFANDPVLVKSVEKKQMNTSSSSGALFGEPDGHKTRQEDQLKLEETCVMVTRDELQFVHKQGVNANTNKKRLRPFSLSKSARKKEYEELAVLHGKSEKVKRDCAENQKKLLLPSISEHEWELV